MSPSSTTPPALQEATRNSTVTWQDDLKSLFVHAKDRFADVVWELADEKDKAKGVEEIWGHKAVVYARAPPTFQARYFSFKPPPATSPLPYSSSPTGTLPAQSALSLSLGLDFRSTHSRSPSPFRAVSPAPSTNTGALLRLPTPINPTLFSNELEYLYTGKGLGAAFEFLFDSAEILEKGDGEDARIDKLRKDLVFMWRSRLYSDVRITLTGNFSSSNHENATAIFSSHRFILVSRSPYFHTQLLSWGVQSTPGEPLTLTLPSPPFTPASLHFTLGFIYTGTLVFSHRTFDLDTAFHIMRSASYLSLDTLYDEIQARIVQEMMHGLFHAFLEFSEYECITGGKWGTGGCRCRQCARRAPRVLEFAVTDDVKNAYLERGARRALVGLFGEGWCTSEFAGLSQKTRDSLVKGLEKRTTPINIFPLLFAAQVALNKLNSTIESWAEVSRDMIIAARKHVDQVLCAQADQCFEQPEWLEIMEANGTNFDHAEQVELIMQSLRRGMNEKNAAMLYQTLVSSILLRTDPTGPENTMLPMTSPIRRQVDEVRMDVLRWLRRRWLGVKQEGGFDALESWAAKEIAEEIEVDVEELFSPVSTSVPPRGPTPKGGLRPSMIRGDENDTGSMHSLRTAIIRKNGDVKPSAASVRSLARSTHSTISRTSTAVAMRRAHGHRPDSKLTPTTSIALSSARSSTADSDAVKAPTPPPKSTVPSIIGRRNISSSTSTHDNIFRPKSTASVRSAHSTVSTIRKTVAGPSTLRPPSGLSRPSSTHSATSEGSTTFETAKSEVTPSSVSRPRRGSATSMLSTASVRTTATSTPRVAKPRPPSITKSITPSVRSKRPPSSPVDRTKLAPAARRTSSAASVRSTTSTTSFPAKKVLLKKPSSTSSSPKSISRSVSGDVDEGMGTIKGKTRSTTLASHEKQASVVSSSSQSTARGSLKRKSSSDTIKESSVGDALAREAMGVPRGATLDIGIPCIISSKKARFRAYARYIGEVEGEAGPWVGVEVPMNDTWPGEKLDGRQWNDGSWGGIRYFDIGGSQSEWEFGEERAARRRRIDWVNNLGRDPKTSLKREGEQLSIERAKRLRSASPAVSDMSTSESRGLFVRPQQVLYVVDAVGSDL
ncbi:hypothetical protein SCP_0507720 [Sparassis crispa]|uniref:BTB domain-containing protein n=1 Tax=Sparassis crispa TaxID=139825 RepID=A0A401GNC6_9APHY|nr:hypothetical protein SCP_0507720 [Sparassis crispa]GBE83716.1 hypothetical protein SCP_0507720 [Sparassis crispa]